MKKGLHSLYSTWKRRKTGSTLRSGEKIKQSSAAPTKRVKGCTTAFQGEGGQERRRERKGRGTPFKGRRALVVLVRKSKRTRGEGRPLERKDRKEIWREGGVLGSMGISLGWKKTSSVIGDERTTRLQRCWKGKS